MKTNSNELVSVIMPAYNSARYIADSIHSLLAQSYTNWELIVVDDGSIDATGDIVQGFCKQDSRVKYLYQRNARQSRARNNGIEHSCGQYIAFLDSDDLWLPQKLEAQVDILSKGDYDLVFSDAYVFSQAFNLTERHHSLLQSGRGFFSGEQGVKTFLEKNQIPMLTVLVKRAVLAKVGGFTENQVQNAEDYHLWLKLLFSGSAFFGLDEPLAAYRVHPESVSSSDRFCLDSVIEVKASLMNVFPEWRNRLALSTKSDIKAILENEKLYTDQEIFKLLILFLSITHYYPWRPIFWLFRTANSRQTAIRTLHFIINYL